VLRLIAEVHEEQTTTIPTATTTAAATASTTDATQNQPWTDLLDHMATDTGNAEAWRTVETRRQRLQRGGKFHEAARLPLPDTTAATDALKVALAYAVQLVDEVPASDHDVPVDLVVTEDEIWIAEEA